MNFGSLIFPKWDFNNQHFVRSDRLGSIDTSTIFTFTLDYES